MAMRREREEVKGTEVMREGGSDGGGSKGQERGEMWVGRVGEKKMSGKLKLKISNRPRTPVVSTIGSTILTFPRVSVDVPNTELELHHRTPPSSTAGGNSFDYAVVLKNFPEYYRVNDMIKLVSKWMGEGRIVFLGVDKERKEEEEVVGTRGLLVLCMFREEVAALKLTEEWLEERVKNNLPETCQALPVDIQLELTGLSNLSYDPLRDRTTDIHDPSPCPVCLEKLVDPTTQNCIVTILCRHSFHANCLLTWGDNSCPVCRHTLNHHHPDLILSEGILPFSELHCCSTCQTSDDLWLCLICGNKGCGRQLTNHAGAHARAMGHRLGLELTTRSVYDLVSFRHIHSLSQPPVTFNSQLLPSGPSLSSTSSKSDPGKPEDHEQVTLLKTQLESQRLHYENQLNRLNLTHHQLSTQLAETEAESRSLADSTDQTISGLGTLRRQLVDRQSELQNLEADLARSQTSLQYYQRRGDDLAVQLAQEKLALGQVELSVAELEATLSSRMKLLS